MKKFPATAEYFFTNPIPWKLGDKTDTPTIDKLFGDWINTDEDKKKEIDNKQILFEIASYCLTQNYDIHALFCFLGSGRNGKSKYQDFISNLVGRQNKCTTDFVKLTSGNARFETTNMYKKTVCLIGEIDYDEVKNSGLIKQLTGGDDIRFEWKNRNGFITDKNTAKIIVNANHIPSTNDATDGFYSRWIIVDFPNQFEGGTDILKTIPTEEYENFCLKSIDILHNLLGKGKFFNQGSLEDRKRRYDERSNTVETFLNEYYVEDNVSNSKIALQEAFREFLIWADTNKKRKLIKNLFKKQVEKKYAVSKSSIQIIGENGTKTWDQDIVIHGLKKKVKL